MGRSAHLAYHVHKSGSKTSILLPGGVTPRVCVPHVTSAEVKSLNSCVLSPITHISYITFQSVSSHDTDPPSGLWSINQTSEVRPKTTTPISIHVITNGFSLLPRNQKLAEAHQMII